MDDTMYRKHSILCSTDQYRSVNVYFIMIHWSVTIFPYNISSSISILHPYTKKKKLSYICRTSQIWIYLHVCATATGFYLQKKDAICVPQGCKVTFIHIKNNHVCAGYQEESSSISYPRRTFLLLTGCPHATQETCDLNHYHFLLNI